MKLRLINFRSYKDVAIEFGPGVNVITGENDSGKTNLLRAINLVVNNRPTGDDYRSDWGGDTEVSLSTDGKVVGRHRTDNENFYTLIHKNGKQDVFKAFGTGVPDIIRQHLNISPVNIAFQLEGPFLLGRSAADVAKHFNSVVNLDVIDSTISNISSTLRKERAALKVENERKESLTEKLSAYDWLDDAEIKLIELERVQGVITGLKTRWTTLYALTKDFKRLAESNQVLDEITRHDKAVIKLLQQNNDIELSTNSHSRLSGLAHDFKTLIDIDKNLNAIAKHEEVVKDLLLQAQDIEFLKTDMTKLSINTIDFEALTVEKMKCGEVAQHEDKVNKLKTLSAELIERTKAYDVLYDLLEQHDKLGEQLADAGDELTDLKSEFKELLPKMCPIFDIQCDHIDKANSKGDVKC